MPIKKASMSKQELGPRELPLAFRFAKTTLVQLNSLAVYGNITMTSVMETLIADEYSRLSKLDAKGIEAARVQGSKAMSKRRKSSE